MGNTDVKPVLFVWAGRQKWGQRPAVPMEHLGWPAVGGCGFAKGAARKTGPQNPRKRRLRRAWIVLNRRTVLELP